MTAAFHDLFRMTEHGLYCPQGGFYVDPRHAVARAVVTHAHGDHAGSVHRSTIAHPVTVALMRHRLRRPIPGTALGYRAPLELNGVRVSLHPAGHIHGSAQVRVEYRGIVGVVTGDFKSEPDGFTEPYEQLSCDVLVMESTFGLPIYRWRPHAEVLAEMADWHERNLRAGRNSVLVAYALGKAQRLLQGLYGRVENILVHKSIAGVNAALHNAGVVLPPAEKLTAARLDAGVHGALIIAPAQALREGWMPRLGPVAVAVVSGWMAVRRFRTRRGTGEGFVLSDHADWPGLTNAAESSGARHVLVTHGQDVVFSRWLRERGMTAEPLDHYEHNGRDAARAPAPGGEDE